jgi:hypothetical protein
MIKSYFAINSRLCSILIKPWSQFNIKSVTDMHIRVMTVTWVELFQKNMIFMEYSKQIQIFLLSAQNFGIGHQFHDMNIDSSTSWANWQFWSKEVHVIVVAYKE